MPDILIRNVPSEDLALLDEHAARLGISRSEYLRRHLQQAARRTAAAVTVADLEQFSHAFSGLADNDLMSKASS